MRAFNKNLRISVTLLITTMLVACLVAPAHAIRKRGKVRPVAAGEYVSPWSFQIALDEQFADDDGEDYSGIVFSVNRFYTGSSAVRFSLGFGERTPGFGERKIFHSDGLVYTFDDYDQFDLSSVNFSLQGMFYSSPRPEPRFYLGIGPRVSISDASPLVTVGYFDDFYYDDFEILDYDDGTHIALGAESSLGFEVFFGRNVSMLAEWEITFQKEWYILEFDYYDRYGRMISETETFDDGFHVDASRLRLGLSVYF